MAALLDLDDVCAGHPKALAELECLRQKATRQAADERAWSDMESAPRDGTAVLGFANGVMATVHFDVAGGYWHLCQCGACGSYADDCEWTPTHWTPLLLLPVSA